MLELKELQKQKIEQICRDFRVSILLLFGSQVSGKTTKESDIDLAFAGDHSLTFEEESQFNAELQAVFGEPRVETIDLYKTNPLLKKRIFDGHTPLYLENYFLYHTLASYALKSYIETKHLRDNVERYLKQKYA